MAGQLEQGSGRRWLRHVPALLFVAGLAVLVPRAGLVGGAVLAVVFLGHLLERALRARQDAEAGARDREERFRSLVQQASDVIMVIADARLTYVSPSVERVLGYPEHRLLDVPYLDLVHPDDRDTVVSFVAGLMDEPGASGLIECRLRHRDGHWVPFEASCRNLLHDPRIAGFVTTGRDVSERKALEEQLQHRAFHDALTGLANRTLFRDRVEHTVSRAGRTPSTFAVLYVDLDGFKAVNDTLGHAVGDTVLVEVSQRLQEAIRDGDTAARLGGDEFAVLVDDLDGAAGAARVARRILDGVRRPVRVEGHEVLVDASIGIALGEPDRSGDELLRNADIAMYMAKNAGKGCFELFQPSMHVAVIERLQVENDLQRAVDRDELILHYQPLVDLEQGGIVGVEALLRWEHPDRGTIGPAEFLAVAEETGLIVPIGRRVLHDATRQLAAWQDRHPAAAPLTVGVNVSMRQLTRGDLVTDVRDALRDSGLAPDRLTLELGESALVEEPDATIRILHRLKEQGVRLAIDDFGTGYSSLSYLQRFPVDVVKIDRSLVERLASGAPSAPIVRAIVEVAHSLGLRTVAEGIERTSELDGFRALGCHLGQGHLFAPAADRDTTEALLAGAPDLRVYRGGWSAASTSRPGQPT